MPQNSIIVEPFNAGYAKPASLFCSGNTYLDRFLTTGDALNAAIGKTYVFLSDDRNTIIGYYNLGTGYIEQQTEQGSMKIGGAIHINCFALDEKYHHMLVTSENDEMKLYLSDLLLTECLERINWIRQEIIGFAFVTLCSTEQGYKLYERNGFMELAQEKDLNFNIKESDQDCYLMYLPLDYE